MPLPRDRDAFLFVHLAHLTPDVDDLCVICHDPYDTEHVPVRIVGIADCSHVFGRDCLVKWFNSGTRNNNTCPMCRTRLFGQPESSSTFLGQIEEFEEEFLRRSDNHPRNFRRSENHPRNSRPRLVDVMLTSAERIMFNGLRLQGYAIWTARPEHSNTTNESGPHSAAVSDASISDSNTPDIFTTSGVLTPPAPHDISNDSQGQAFETESLARLIENLRAAQRFIAGFMDLFQPQYDRTTNADAPHSASAENNRLVELTYMVEEFQVRRGEIRLINLGTRYLPDDQYLRGETMRLNTESRGLEERFWALVAETRTHGGNSEFLRQEIEFLSERFREMGNT